MSQCFSALIGREICEGYKDSPVVRFASGRHSMFPSQDYISVLSICDYEKRRNIIQHYFTNKCIVQVIVTA